MLPDADIKPGRSRLTDEERVAVHRYLNADRIPMDSDTREYLIAEAQSRGMTFGEIISALLLAIADDGMARAILEE